MSLDQLQLMTLIISMRTRFGVVEDVHKDCAAARPRLHKVIRTLTLVAVVKRRKLLLRGGEVISAATTSSEATVVRGPSILLLLPRLLLLTTITFLLPLSLRFSSRRDHFLDYGS